MILVYMHKKSSSTTKMKNNFYLGNLASNFWFAFKFYNALLYFKVTHLL